MYLIERSPRLAAGAFCLGVCLLIVAIWSTEADRPRREAEYAAWWRANLECRQAGGTYEYFGPEGYACIGARK